MFSMFAAFPDGGAARLDALTRQRDKKGLGPKKNDYGVPFFAVVEPR